MRAICFETDQDPVPKCVAFVRKCVNVIRGFLSYVLNVQNRCLFTALQKLTKSEDPLLSAKVFKSNPVDNRTLDLPLREVHARDYK